MVGHRAELIENSKGASEIDGDLREIRDRLAYQFSISSM
jgi:hypothetical protein